MKEIRLVRQRYIAIAVFASLAVVLVFDNALHAWGVPWMPARFAMCTAITLLTVVYLFYLVSHCRLDRWAMYILWAAGVFFTLTTITELHAVQAAAAHFMGTDVETFHRLVTVSFRDLMYPTLGFSLICLILAHAERSTELAARESEATTSENRYRAILRAVPDLVIRVNRDGTYLDFLPGPLFVTNRPPQEFLGKNITDMFSGTVASRSLDLIADTLEEGTSQTGEFEYMIGETLRNFEARTAKCGLDEVVLLVRDVTELRTAEAALVEAHDHLERSVEVRTAELRVANEHLEQEIAQRKQVEVGLRASEERFRRLVDSSLTGFFLTEGEPGTVGYANQQALSIFELSQDELCGFGWQRRLHPDDRQRVLAETTDAAESRVQFQQIFRLQFPDGRTKWVQAGSTPIDSTGDNHVSRVGFAEEITERIRTEDELQKRQSELAHVSRLNTMGEMASGLAHELAQPLYAITNYARGALHRLRSGEVEQQEMTQVMQQLASEAQRAAEVIRRLRAFISRREVRLSAVDVNESVRTVVQLSEVEIRRSNVMVVLDLAEGLSPILADSIQIEQVLLNLLRNAIESLQENDVDDRVVTIRTASTDGDSIQVDVIDRGVGFEDVTPESAFEPFLTTKEEGLGMGLAISRTIIDAHEGKLWATANGDRGATFHCLLRVNHEMQSVQD